MSGINLLKILAKLVETELAVKRIRSYDLNNEKNYKAFLEDLEKRGYKLAAANREDSPSGYEDIRLYEYTAAHSPSEEEPTYYLVIEAANDTGDWWATVYALF